MQKNTTPKRPMSMFCKQKDYRLLGYQQHLLLTHPFQPCQCFTSKKKKAYSQSNLAHCLLLYMLFLPFTCVSRLTNTCWIPKLVKIWLPSGGEGGRFSLTFQFALLVTCAKSLWLLRMIDYTTTLSIDCNVQC
jgi:hypothetical protein